MTRKERYRSDPEYRAKVNKENRDRYHRRITDPLYAKTCATRARIWNARNAILHHDQRLEFFYKRIAADLKLLKKLTSRA